VAIEPAARIAFLKKIHLFYGLKDDELAVLADQLTEQLVNKNEVIFEQDSKPDSFYLIYNGNVRITRKQQERKEIQLALLVKNDYFGEMALVTNRRRSGTAVALAETTLLRLSRAHFELLYKNAPHIQTSLALAVRSRQLARKLQFKWLRSDEVIYFLARKHWIVLWEKMLEPLGYSIIPVAAFYVWIFYLHTWVPAFIGIVSLLYVAARTIWLYIDWGNDYYIVTNQRVVWLEKVIGIYDSRQESPINNILSVGIETNQLGRALDYGNVVVRTFVGKIPFNHVQHPNEAAKMVEEYWNRTKEHAAGVEREALKNAIRKRLNLPLKQERGFGEPAPQPKSAAPVLKPSAGLAAILRFLGTDSLKLRYESGDTVVYRKHWVVLVIDAWISVLGSLGTLLAFFARLFHLAFLPNEAFISFQNGGISVDVWAMSFLIAFFPFFGWFVYQVMDWSNDRFEVTNDQIIDIDRKPFTTETRNVAPLDGIMGTQYERKGVLGNLFNYGSVHITAGGNKFTFEDVMDPATVQSDIDRRRMVRKAKQAEAQVAAERDRMAEWIATYHRAAEEFRKEDEENKKNQKK
jgi:cyclic nucleotide-binding protein